MRIEVANSTIDLTENLDFCQLLALAAQAIDHIG